MAAPTHPEALEHEHHEHSHPTAGTYLKVGVTLVILTAMEVGIYYVPQMRPVLVPLLILLATVKFALVAMFYMHLKMDSKLFSGLFVFPLLIASIVIVALMVLMAYHYAFANANFHNGVWK